MKLAVMFLLFALAAAVPRCYEELFYTSGVCIRYLPSADCRPWAVEKCPEKDRSYSYGQYCARWVCLPPKHR